MSVSIIVPVYNVEKYLRKCLDSLCAQDDCVEEIILINDGSTDGSLSVCEEYAEKNRRIKLINQVNKGVEEAVYAGMVAAKSEYIGFVDGDDYIDALMFKKLYDKITQTQADFIICGYNRVDENYNILSQYRLDWLQQEVFEKNDGVFSADFLPRLQGKEFMSYARWNKLFKREQLLNNPFCRPHGLKVGEDTAMVYSMLFSSSKVACIDECLYYYVQRTGSIVHSFDDTYIKNWETVAEVLNTASSEFGCKTNNFNEVALALLYHLCLGKIRAAKMSRKKRAAAYKKIGDSIVAKSLMRSVKVKMPFRRKLVFSLIKYKCYHLLSLIY